MRNLENTRGKNEQPPDYADTVKYHGLSDRDMRIQCPDEVLNALAEKLTDWRTFQLWLPEGVVEDIDKDRNASELGKRQELLKVETEVWSQSYLRASCALSHRFREGRPRRPSMQEIEDCFSVTEYTRG